MAGTTLQTRAVITAVDQMTGPLAKIGSNAARFSMNVQRSFDGIVKPYANFMGKLGTMPIMGAGFAGGLFSGAILKDQVHLDKLARQTRAIAEIGENRWNFQLDKALKTGNEYGIKPEEIVHGAKSWLELGNSIESYTENLKIAGKTSKITGISIAEQMTETSAIVKAFGEDPKNHHVFREYERAYLVGAKGMKGGAHAYGEAMKNFAPIAKSMGLNVQQASGFVQALGGQFEAGEIGNAMKMGFARLMSPTAKAQAALRASGIDTMQFWETDKKRLAGSGHSFAERLRGTGKMVDSGLEARLSQIMAETDTSKGGKLLTDRLTAELTNAWGRKGKGKNAAAHLQGEDSKLVAALIAQHVMGFQGKLNVPEFFRIMEHQAGNVPLIKELFGGHHIAKFQDLFRQGHHVAERIEHNTKYSNQMKYGTKFGLMWREDVIDRRAKIVFQGLSHQFERMQASWLSFWASAGSTGLTRDAAGFFKTTADFLDKLRATDPNTVRTIAWGLGSMAALPIGVFAIKAVASSLGAIAALGMAPVRSLGALAAIPFATAARGMLRMGAATRILGFSLAGNGIMGLGRVAGAFGAIARFTTMGAALGGMWMLAENFDQIMPAFEALGKSDAAKEAMASFGKLGETAKGLGGDVAKAVDGFFKLVGWKQEGGTDLKSWLDLAAAGAGGLAWGLDQAATALRSLFNADVKPPAWLQWLQNDSEKLKAQGGLAGGVWEDVKKGWANFMAYPEKGPQAINATGDAFAMPTIRPWGEQPGDRSAWGANPFERATSFERASPFNGADGLVVNNPDAITSPIVDATNDLGSGIGDVRSSVDAIGASIVNAVNGLGSSIAAATSAPRNATAPAPAGGNATGARR